MKKLLLVLFVSIPLLIFAVILSTPDKAISDNENRSLKTRDNISINTFQEDFEAYLSDQLPLRDKVVSAQYSILHAAGKRDINGCYICKDRFVQKITDSDVDINACERYADKINNLAKNTDTYVMLVPSAGVVEEQFLPTNAKMYDYEKLYGNLSSRLSDAHIINIKQALSFDGAYYKTDHHWTYRGAYSAYKEWCSATGYDFRQYDHNDITYDFRGTLYSKVPIGNIYDTIKAPIINEEIVVTADGQSILLYDDSAIDAKDKYNYFEGGNHGILTIENKNSDNSKTLLILKDSFANSFIPYLIPYYSKIIMLDERYTFTSPSDIIEKENITEILVLKEIIS